MTTDVLTKRHVTARSQKPNVTVPPLQWRLVKEISDLTSSSSPASKTGGQDQAQGCYRGLPVLPAGAKPATAGFSDNSSPALAKSFNRSTQEHEGPQMSLVIPPVRAHMGVQLRPGLRAASSLKPWKSLVTLLILLSSSIEVVPWSSRHLASHDAARANFASLRLLQPGVPSL
jgi:hypothetical protein